MARWDAVGYRAKELRGAPRSLPASEDSLCRIAQLNDIAFRKALPKLRQDMPRKEVRALIKELNPPRKLTDTEQEEDDKRKRMRVEKAFFGLPEKHQFVLGVMAKDRYGLRANSSLPRANA